jgi:hypothetical protein
MNELDERLARVDAIDAPDLWPAIVTRRVPPRKPAPRAVVILVAFAVFASGAVLAWRALSPADDGPRPLGASDGPTIELAPAGASGEPTATLTFDGDQQLGRFIDDRYLLDDDGSGLGIGGGWIEAVGGVPGFVRVPTGAEIRIVGAEELFALISAGFVTAESEGGVVVAETPATHAEGGWVLDLDDAVPDRADVQAPVPGRVGLLLLGRWPDGEPFGVLFGLDVLASDSTSSASATPQG